MGLPCAASIAQLVNLDFSKIKVQSSNFCGSIPDVQNPVFSSNLHHCQIPEGWMILRWTKAVEFLVSCRGSSGTVVGQLRRGPTSKQWYSKRQNCLLPAPVSHVPAESVQLVTAQ